MDVRDSNHLFSRVLAKEHLLFCCCWLLTGLVYIKIIISSWFFRLFGNAKYVVDGNKHVLYLDGVNSYAEVPAVDIRTTSFTMTCWIKIPFYPTIQGTIFADWSHPFQFRFYVDRWGRHCPNLRRPGQRSSREMINTCRYFLLNWKHMHELKVWKPYIARMSANCWSYK